MPEATPLFQSVNPDGTVTFEFTGHVKATGLDLPAVESGTPQDENRIRWIREADDVAVAFEQGSEGGGSQSLLLEAGDGTGGLAQLTLDSSLVVPDQGSATLAGGSAMLELLGDTTLSSIYLNGLSTFLPLAEDDGSGSINSHFLQDSNAIPRRVELHGFYGPLAIPALGAHVGSAFLNIAADPGNPSLVLLGSIVATAAGVPSMVTWAWRRAGGQLQVALFNAGAAALAVGQGNWFGIALTFD